MKVLIAALGAQCSLVPKPLSDPHICLEPSKTLSSLDKQTLTTQDLGKYNLPHQRGSGILCCLWHKIGHDKGALSTYVLQKVGVSICKKKKQLSSVHDGYWLIPRNKLLIAGVLLPSFRKKHTSKTWPLILLNTLEWKAGQWAAGSFWVFSFNFSNWEIQRGNLSSFPQHTAPWTQSGPWRNQHWMESQSPSLTSCISSHATSFLWSSVHSPLKEN